MELPTGIQIPCLIKLRRSNAKSGPWLVSRGASASLRVPSGHHEEMGVRRPPYIDIISSEPILQVSFGN